MVEWWRRAGADQADVRFWPRQSQRHRKCSDRIASKGHRICWAEAFPPSGAALVPARSLACGFATVQLLFPSKAMLRAHWMK
jgi:hypothetical protein